MLVFFLTLAFVFLATAPSTRATEQVTDLHIMDNYTAQRVVPGRHLVGLDCTVASFERCASRCLPLADCSGALFFDDERKPNCFLFWSWSHTVPDTRATLCRKNYGRMLSNWWNLAE
jgi:hypothetical protein